MRIVFFNLVFLIIYAPANLKAQADSTESSGLESTMSHLIHGQPLKTEGDVTLRCSIGGWKVPGVKIACNHSEGIGICYGGNGKASAQGIQVSKAMYRCMNKVIPICLEHIKCDPKKIKLVSNGGHVDRKTRGGSSASNHCGGYAFDLNQIRCGDKVINLTLKGRKQDSATYDAFGFCWNKQVEINCDSKSKSASNEFINSVWAGLIDLKQAHAVKGSRASYLKHCKGCIGSPFPQDSNHNDHMHLGMTSEKTGKAL